MEKQYAPHTLSDEQLSYELGYSEPGSQRHYDLVMEAANRGLHESDTPTAAPASLVGGQTTQSAREILHDAMGCVDILNEDELREAVRAAWSALTASPLGGTQSANLCTCGWKVGHDSRCAVYPYYVAGMDAVGGTQPLVGENSQATELAQTLDVLLMADQGTYKNYVDFEGPHGQKMALGHIAHQAAGMFNSQTRELLPAVIAALRAQPAAAPTPVATPQPQTQDAAPTKEEREAAKHRKHHLKRAYYFNGRKRIRTKRMRAFAIIENIYNRRADNHTYIKIGEKGYQVGKDFLRRKIEDIRALRLPAAPQHPTQPKAATEQPDYLFLQCPECDFSAVVAAKDYRPKYCGICAGDTGDDVRMNSRTCNTADKPSGPDDRQHPTQPQEAASAPAGPPVGSYGEYADAKSKSGSTRMAEKDWKKLSRAEREKLVGRGPQPQEGKEEGNA